jgi:CRP-like cAMP-binding protein
MNTDLIVSTIHEYIQPTEEEVEFFLSVLVPRPFKQGELIISGGEPARYMIFVNAGYLMTYYTDLNGSDHVIQFAGEGWWSGDIHSITEQSRTRYSSKGLSEGEVLLLPRPAQQQLLDRYVKFERYFRIMFQKGLMRQQLRYIEGHSTSAEERYRSFVSAYPAIVREVPQKYIASYLGITPEFLSKIRKKLAVDKS